MYNGKITFKIIHLGCKFHGFTFKAGFVWGKSLDGTEFAASGWESGGYYYIYRRQKDGSWIGGWESYEADFHGCDVYEFFPASDAAQLLQALAEGGLLN